MRFYPLKWIDRGLPIADKIGIPLAAIAVFTAAALSIHTIGMTRKQIDRSYRTQARQIASLVQAQLSSHLQEIEDRSTTSLFLQELKHLDSTILDLHIYRFVNGQPILWASSHGGHAEDDQAHSSPVPFSLTHDVQQILSSRSKQLETIVPLTIGNQPAASIVLYTSLTERDEAITAAAKMIILTSGFGISGQSVALMLVLYWVVLKRLRQLSQAALRVAEGDTTVRLHHLSQKTGRDEILNVAREFDRMLEAVQRRSQQQETLTELGQQAVQATQLSDLLDKAVEMVARTLNLDYVEVSEWLPKQQSLQLRAMTGWAPYERTTILPVAVDSPIAHTLQTSEPAVIDHVEQEQRFRGLQWLQQQGVISSLSVLIGKFEAPFGILSVHTRTQRRFLKDDILFLKSVANLISAAIDRHQVETVMAHAEAAVARAEAAEVAKQALETEILERQRVEAALRESEERYALAAIGANDGLWDWDLRTNAVYFSGRWKTMLGYEEWEIGHHPCEWFDRIHPDDQERVQRELTQHREGLTAHFESEFRLRRKDQSYCWILSRGLAVRDHAGQVYRLAGSQTDVTDRKQAEAKLLHHALHDELTSLANRALFTERLEQAINQPQPLHPTFAVVFLDLDRFKVINDSLGHLAGDQLLVITAERLKQCLRPSDTCARLGGDEFAILLEPLQDPSEAITIVEQIREALRAPFGLAGQEVFVNGSIGLVLDTQRYHHKEELLRDADTAMYRAKAAGRGCYTIFTPMMHEQAVTLLHLEADLRRAIDRQELILNYQPIMSLTSQRLTGFEALLRWQHPQRGLLLPAEFISLAEETGLILSIGEWVLQQACSQMKQWIDEFALDPPVTISVNLSGKQFAQPDLVEQIARILQTTDLAPHRLKLEITESVIMTDANAAAQMMQQLKTLGVQLAMDDFGTGYSSLGYLHRFPIDTLKIDQSFINSADTNLEKLEITRTVIALAWNLGVNVVAEGVETSQQMAQLKLLKCELGQGFLLSHPLDRAGIAQLLQSHPGFQFNRGFRSNPATVVLANGEPSRR